MRELIPYFQDVVRILTDIEPSAEVIAGPEIEERDNQFGSLALRVRYADGSTLHVELWADCSDDPIEWGPYSFHYMDSENRLRFRYDNAPHHPQVASFPHHLHLGAHVRNVLPFGPPRLHRLADAIRWHLDHPGQQWHPGMS